jgi:hypothetical protein
METLSSVATKLASEPHRLGGLRSVITERESGYLEWAAIGKSTWDISV